MSKKEKKTPSPNIDFASDLFQCFRLTTVYGLKKGDGVGVVLDILKLLAPLSPTYTSESLSFLQIYPFRCFIH